MQSSITRAEPVPLENASRAHIRFEHAGGQLTVRAGADPLLLLAGELGEHAVTEVRRAGEQADVVVRPIGDGWRSWLNPAHWCGQDRHFDVDVRLSPAIPLALEFGTGASKNVLDLSGLRATEVVVNTGMSHTELTVPTAGQSKAEVHASLAHVTIHVPPGVAASIQGKVGLGALEVDQTRFPPTAEGFESPDFATATNRAQIRIDGGLESVKVVSGGQTTTSPRHEGTAEVARGVEGVKGAHPMDKIAAPPPSGATSASLAGERAPRRTRLQSILLGCGIVSGTLYFAGDVLMSAVYPGYSYLHQTVSELNAQDAPTRGLSVALGLASYLLLVPFGVGIWRSAAESRARRVAGGALAVMGICSLWSLPFASMQPRGTEQPIAHAISGIVGMLLLVAAIGCAAVASGRRFRWYSIATIVVALAFSGWAAMDAVRIEQGLATPWVGLKERIGFYSWHLWFIAFALTQLRRLHDTRARRAGPDVAQ